MFYWLVKSTLYSDAGPRRSIILSDPEKIGRKTQQSLRTLSCDGHPSRWLMSAEQLRKLYDSLAE